MKKNFRQRVIDFWKEFEKEEAGLRKIMDEKTDPQTLVKTMNSVLLFAFDDPYFQMGINDEGKYELILTPEGNRARLLQIHYCVERAPESLKEKWNFYSTKPAHMKDTETLQMYDLTITPQDVTPYYEIDEERRKINIQIYSPKLMTLENDNRYNMLFILLDQAIGELYTMEYIGYIDFVEEKQNLPNVGLVEFKGVIDRTIKDKGWSTLDNPVELYSGYRLEPNEKEGWKIREDAYIGVTSCIPIVNKFLQHDNSLFDSFEENGIIFGFLFYENINVPQDRMVPQRAEIEDKIIALTEQQGIAQSIGGATGSHFSYMDFIIYDYDAFIRIAKEVMSGYKFEETGFSKFIFGDDPMWF